LKLPGSSREVIASAQGDAGAGHQGRAQSHLAQRPWSAAKRWPSARKRNLLQWAARLLRRIPESGPTPGDCATHASSTDHRARRDWSLVSGRPAWWLGSIPPPKLPDDDRSPAQDQRPSRCARADGLRFDQIVRTEEAAQAAQPRRSPRQPPPPASAATAWVCEVLSSRTGNCRAAASTTLITAHLLSCRSRSPAQDRGQAPPWRSSP